MISTYAVILSSLFMCGYIKCYEISLRKIYEPAILCQKCVKCHFLSLSFSSQNAFKNILSCDGNDIAVKNCKNDRNLVATSVRVEKIGASTMILNFFCKASSIAPVLDSSARLYTSHSLVLMPQGFAADH